jgi:lipid-binding SYLF domain-containing protein
MIVAGLLAAPVLADEDSTAKRLNEAEQVIKNAVDAPDKGVPKELMERAECIGVFPELHKGAFVVGAEFGHGVFTCRGQDGKMGAPAFFQLGAGSVGWQFGGEEADLIVLIMNESGMKHLLQDKFTLGAEAGVAAGPVGRKAEASTDAQLHAQILTWSRSKGLFVGVAVEGSVIKPDKKTMEKFYGKPMTAKQVLVEKSVPVPNAARSFVDTVSRSASRS